MYKKNKNIYLIYIIMPFCKNDPKKKYKGDEPSPKGLGYCAHSEKEGVKKKGKDRNMWEVKKVKNGSKRWIKISNKNIINNKKVNIYNPFIKNIVIPILHDYSYDNIIICKDDIIQIEYDCESINKNIYFKVINAIYKKYKKIELLNLVAEFTPNSNQIKDNKIIHYCTIYDKKINKDIIKQIDIPIEIISNDKALIKLNIENIYDSLYNLNVIEKPSFNIQYEKYQNSKCKNYLDSGVITTKINDKIINKIMEDVNFFSNKTKKDYHPFSNKKVRDLIHPSMFPYIKSISKFNAIYNKEKKQLFLNGKNQVDFWNRKYEKSKYQWLPSEFKIDSKGKCKIESYINNLPDNFVELNESIELLFEKVLPYFEKIWSYIKTIKLYDNEDTELFNNEEKFCKNNEIKNISLKNKTLQVITKIVTYELNNEKMEGTWHVEGMSHENIVATAVTVLEQDNNFNAELLFKRRFTSCEGAMMHSNTGQDRPEYINKYLGYYSDNNDSNILTGLVPICKTITKKGSLTIFPNSHIHKLNTENISKKSGKRTVIVFWLINPERRIISTKYVNSQQKNITIKNAENHRIKLMEERKYHKQKFNVRDLNLCEH